MPTVMLTGTAPAHLPARPITLIVERDDRGEAVELVVNPSVQTVRPKAGMLVLPAVPRALTVSVRPSSGGRFATPTVLHLTAIVTTPGTDDHDRVVVPSIQVSGLSSIDLLVLAPSAGQVTLTRPEQAKEAVLSPLGNAALVVGRALIGSAQAPNPAVSEINVVVDGSVSMITAIRSGAVSTAVDLLTGIASALREARMATVVAVRPPASVEVEASRLAGEVRKRLTGAALTTGFSAGAHIAATEGITYVVTDSIPSDQDQLGSSWHVVLLADRDAEPVARALCAVPVTVVDAAPGNDQALLTDQALLEHTVASLLTVIGVGGAR